MGRGVFLYIYEFFTYNFSKFVFKKSGFQHRSLCFRCAFFQNASVGWS